MTKYIAVSSYRELVISCVLTKCMVNTITPSYYIKITVKIQIDKTKRQNTLQ